MSARQERSRGFFQEPHGESSSSALWGLFRYSAMMFVLPVCAYFGTKRYINDNMAEVAPPWDALYSAMVAVATVNVVIVLYVIKAFREVGKEEEAKKRN